MTPTLEVPGVGRHLAELERKGFIRPVASSSEREDAFSFHHVLIRDVAYGSIPKGERADLHEGVAEWLDAQGGEDDELIGYHLERAYLLHVELGAADRHARRLALDAGDRLATAGIGAWKRADSSAASNLVSRSVALLPPDDPTQLELVCELAIAERAAGGVDRACELLDGMIAEAAAIGNRRLELRGQIELSNIRLHTGAGSSADELLELASAGIPVFEESRDDRALARAWLLIGDIHGGMHGQMAAWAEAEERAMEYYERAGWPPSICCPKIAAALYHGPVAAPKAVRRCQELVSQTASDRVSTAGVLVFLGGLVAMQGQFAQARELLSRARSSYEELHVTGVLVGVCDSIRARAEMTVGKYEVAETILRATCELYDELGEHSHFATQAGALAEALYSQSRLEEASEFCRRCAEHAASDDFSAQILWRSVSAKINAREGESAQAEILAREAVDLAARTDALNWHGVALLDLAEVLRLDDRPGEAAAAAEGAVRLFAQKGNSVAIGRAAKLLQLARL